MQQLVVNTHLKAGAADFFIEVVRRCPGVFREREVHWQIKMLSRFSAEREFFEECLTHKEVEFAQVMPVLKLSQLPPSESIPLKAFGRHHKEGWPNIVSFLSQIFLQQILSSADLFLDLGSRTDAFFVSENSGTIFWVPEPVGTRWHVPFRQELAKLYLGWVFEQDRLLDHALMALHLQTLKGEIEAALAHWRGHDLRSLPQNRQLWMDVFLKAERHNLRIHPNALVWAIYELEVFEVLESLELKPDLEHSADELCRMRSHISA